MISSKTEILFRLRLSSVSSILEHGKSSVFAERRYELGALHCRGLFWSAAVITARVTGMRTGLLSLLWVVRSPAARRGLPHSTFLWPQPGPRLEPRGSLSRMAWGRGAELLGHSGGKCLHKKTLCPFVVLSRNERLQFIVIR